MKTLLSIFLLLTFGVYAYSEYTPSPEEFPEWKEAAENGDAKAQSAPGYIYTSTAPEKNILLMGELCEK